MNTKSIIFPSEADVDSFEMLYPMLQSDLREIRELSKKKQDQPLNKFKVDKINKKLTLIKEILKNEESIKFLDLLDSETLPTNSDTVLVLTEYIQAMMRFKERYYSSEFPDLRDLGFGNKWKTKEKTGT